MAVCKILNLNYNYRENTNKTFSIFLVLGLILYVLQVVFQVYLSFLKNLLFQ